MFRSDTNVSASSSHSCELISVAGDDGYHNGLAQTFWFKPGSSTEYVKVRTDVPSACFLYCFLQENMFGFRTEASRTMDLFDEIMRVVGNEDGAVILCMAPGVNLAIRCSH